jgi:hypothetical protein
MIKYALACAEGHAFESWFPDSAAYEKQRKRGFVVCPECGSTRVDKAIMAPAVVPEVARAIHFGEAPERAIRGRASLEEAKSLIEDGVGVMPMPMMEDELN